MKTILSTIIVLFATALPGPGYAGQHSGLGGTPPPAPTIPAPEPTMFETVEQYLNVYYQWLREQVEQAPNVQTMSETR